VVVGYRHGGSCHSPYAQHPECKMAVAAVGQYQTGAEGEACYRSVGEGSRLEEAGG